ncbi:MULTISPECIES: hypothetical protein [Actinomyces]|uniref:Uncharacterized protein n=1 Tax=Actinomyces marmotae TaxID=2737173 RepID=A0A6M8AYL5_9ACTO|nr:MULTISPECIES: hypothetical protein [Actinomyces]QKD78918.1 hypothetical protein HPC72_00350 [Actinomyces marmotae]
MTRRRTLAGALLAASLLTAVAPAASAAEANSQFDQAKTEAVPYYWHIRCAHFWGWLC